MTATKATDYGSRGLALVPRLSIRDERAKILARIDQAARLGGPQPLLLEYINDLDPEAEEQWFVVVNEERLNAFFINREALEKEEMLEMNRLCLELREADASYLDALYEIVYTMTENRMSYYITREKQRAFHRSPDHWIDRTASGIAGPVERTIIFYRLYYNRRETERLKRQEEAEIRHLRAMSMPTVPHLSPRQAPQQRMPLFGAVSESEEDSTMAVSEAEEDSFQATAPSILPPQEPDDSIQRSASRKRSSSRGSNAFIPIFGHLSTSTSSSKKLAKGEKDKEKKRGKK